MDAGLVTSSGDYTVSFWANAGMTQSTYCEIVSQIGDPSPADFYVGKHSNGDIRVADDWQATGIPFPLDQQWHFYSIVTNSQNTLLYLDSELRATRSSPIDYPEGSIFLIGKQYGGFAEYFNGVIDDISIFERALTQEEIEGLYTGFNANFTYPETAYIGEQIQFTDISTGNPTTWEWDFENDGIYDLTYNSFQDTVYWTYENTNVDSVKLRISNDTLVDSLVKEITVEFCPPAPPDSVQVNIIYPDAIISWSAVDTTECGSPIIPDGYIIRYNETASELDEDYYFLNFTTQLTYTHTFVAQYSPQMFYRVIAIKNYTREQIEYLERLNNSREKVKWSEVKRNLNYFRK